MPPPQSFIHTFPVQPPQYTNEDGESVSCTDDDESSGSEEEDETPRAIEAARKPEQEDDDDEEDEDEDDDDDDEETLQLKLKVLEARLKLKRLQKRKTGNKDGDSTGAKKSQKRKSTKTKEKEKDAAAEARLWDPALGVRQHEPPPENEYDTVEEAEKAVRSWGEEHGIAYVRRKWSRKDHKSLVLACKRSGKRRPGARGLRPGASSARIECPFQLYITLKDDKWRIRYCKNGNSHIHNHPPERSKFVFPAMRRATRTDEMRRRLAELWPVAGGPKQVLKLMKQEYPESEWTLGDIRNEYRAQLMANKEKVDHLRGEFGGTSTQSGAVANSEPGVSGSRQKSGQRRPAQTGLLHPAAQQQMSPNTQRGTPRQQKQQQPNAQLTTNTNASHPARDSSAQSSYYMPQTSVNETSRETVNRERGMQQHSYAPVLVNMQHVPAARPPVCHQCQSQTQCQCQSLASVLRAHGVSSHNPWQ